MLNGFSSNAISAKARAIYGKRLTDDNYNELIRLSSVEEVYYYLIENTDYQNYLSKNAKPRRNQLEAMLARANIEKYFKLLHYDFTRKKSFYSYVLLRTEINTVLNAIMLLNTGNIQELIAKLPTFLDDYTNIDFKALSTIKNFNDLLKALEHTKYHKLLEKFNAPNGKINYMKCERTLKVYYYQTVLDLIEKQYKGKLKDELINIVKTEIEFINLSLICRLKFNFNQSDDDIKGQILPFKHKLTKHSLEAMLKTKTQEEFIDIIKKSAESSFEYYYIENYTDNLKYNLHRRAMRFSSNAPIAFFALMSLLEIEVENLKTIIESVRYNTDNDETRRLLIVKK